MSRIRMTKLIKYFLTSALLLSIFTGCTLKLTLEDHDRLMDRIISTVKEKTLSGKMGSTEGLPVAISFKLDLIKHTLIVYHPLTGASQKIDLNDIEKSNIPDDLPRDLLEELLSLNLDDLLRTDWGEIIFYSYIRGNKEVARLEFTKGRATELSVFTGRYPQSYRVSYPSDAILKLEKEGYFWVKILEIY